MRSSQWLGKNKQRKLQLLSGNEKIGGKEGSTGQIMPFVTLVLLLKIYLFEFNMFL